ncbi:hypothetical protein HGRIS_010489 [Hohenbuehelia grisea]|uniref:Uncharacterized protein n=1 Tax=Hohenbuehelia grisea TaxID=104357 RepID=A0ABR3IZP2_9AGAR
MEEHAKRAFRQRGASSAKRRVISLCATGSSSPQRTWFAAGEQAKYPIAVVEHLLDTLGADLGGGYDIGCKFSGTLARSNLGAACKGTQLPRR